jgi:hypothetical protein
MSGEPIDKGVTTRNPAVALLCVNSADQEQFDPATGLRFNSSTPARIYINNQQPALFGYMTRLALTEVSMEWATPNVNDYNNTLTVGYYNNANVLQGIVRIQLANGFYTGARLGYWIMTQLNANATLDAFFGNDTFSVYYGDNLCNTFLALAGTTQPVREPKFTIETSSANGRFAFLPFSKNYPGLPSLRDDLTNMMGLTPSRNPQPAYKQFIGGYASLQYTPFVDIVSNLLTKNQNIRDGTSSKANKTSSILARVYLANENFTARQATCVYEAVTGDLDILNSADNAIGTAPGTLRREFVFPKQIMWNNTENVDVIDIEVLDYRGNPLFYQPTSIEETADSLQIVNTADFFFTLQATEN